MVTDLRIRISPEFDQWLRMQRQRTQFSSAQITRVLAARLNGMDVVEVKPKRFRRQKLTLKRVFETNVEDMFNDFNV